MMKPILLRFFCLTFLFLVTHRGGFGLEGFDDLLKSDVTGGNPFGEVGRDGSVSARLYTLLDDAVLASAADDDERSPLADLWAETNEKMHDALYEEMGRSHPDLDRLSDRMGGFWGHSYRAASRFRRAVIAMRAHLVAEAAKGGATAGALSAMIAQLDDDVARYRREHTTRTDHGGTKKPAEVYCYIPAAARILVWMSLRHQLLGTPGREAEATELYAEEDFDREDPAIDTPDVAATIGELLANDERHEVAPSLQRADLIQAAYSFGKARKNLLDALGLETTARGPAIRDALLNQAARARGLGHDDAPLHALARTMIQCRKELDLALNQYRAAREAQARKSFSAPESVDGVPEGDGSPFVSKVADKGVFESVRREIQDADLKLDAKLFDIDLFRGLKLSTKYRWQVEPSYRDGFHTRIDRWQLRTGLNVGDLLGYATDAVLPVYLRIEPRSEVLFARQFKTWRQAATALPYSPLRLPVTAKKALELDVGDFVSFPVHLQLITGAAKSYGIPFVNLSGGVHYIVSGECRLQIFKEDEKHVRVRMGAFTRKGSGGSFGADLNLKYFAAQTAMPAIRGGLPEDHVLSEHDDLVEKGVVRLLKELVGTRLFQIQGSRDGQQTFLADYTFDLTDPAAADAYDALLNAHYVVKALGVNPMEWVDGLKDRFFQSLLPAETLFVADRGLPKERRRVDRRFKGSNLAKVDSRSMRVGLKLFSWHDAKSFTDNRLVQYDAYNRPQRYLMPVFNHSGSWRLLFGWFKEEKQDMIYGYLPCNQRWEPKGFVDLVFHHRYNDRKAREGELEDVRDDMAASLGALGEKIGLRGMPIVKTENARVDMVFAVHGNVLERILDPEQCSEAELWKAMERTYAAIPVRKSPSNVGSPSHRSMSHRTKTSGYSRFSAAEKAAYDAAYDACPRNLVPNWPKVSRVMEALRRIRVLQNPAYRFEAIKELVSLSYFREAGARFLIEASGSTDHADDFYLRLRVEGKKYEPFIRTLGNDHAAHAYQVVEEILYNIRNEEDRMR